MRQNNIRFTEVDTAASPANKRALKQVNPRGSLPTFVIDGKVKVGFSPGSLNYAIVAAARRRVQRQ